MALCVVIIASTSAPSSNWGAAAATVPPNLPLPSALAGGNLPPPLPSGCTVLEGGWSVSTGDNYLVEGCGGAIATDANVTVTVANNCFIVLRGIALGSVSIVVPTFSFNVTIYVTNMLLKSTVIRSTGPALTAQLSSNSTFVYYGIAQSSIDAPRPLVLSNVSFEDHSRLHVAHSSFGTSTGLSVVSLDSAAFTDHAALRFDNTTLFAKKLNGGSSEVCAAVSMSHSSFATNASLVVTGNSTLISAPTTGTTASASFAAISIVEGTNFKSGAAIQIEGGSQLVAGGFVAEGLSAYAIFAQGAGGSASFANSVVEINGGAQLTVMATFGSAIALDLGSNVVDTAVTITGSETAVRCVPGNTTNIAATLVNLGTDVSRSNVTISGGATASVFPGAADTGTTGTVTSYDALPTADGVPATTTTTVTGHASTATILELEGAVATSVRLVVVGVGTSVHAPAEQAANVIERPAAHAFNGTEERPSGLYVGNEAEMSIRSNARGAKVVLSNTGSQNVLGPYVQLKFTSGCFFRQRTAQAAAMIDQAHTTYTDGTGVDANNASLIVEISDSWRRVSLVDVGAALVYPNASSSSAVGGTLRVAVTNGTSLLFRYAGNRSDLTHGLVYGRLAAASSQASNAVHTNVLVSGVGTRITTENAVFVGIDVYRLASLNFTVTDRAFMGWNSSVENPEKHRAMSNPPVFFLCNARMHAAATEATIDISNGAVVYAPNQVIRSSEDAVPFMTIERQFTGGFNIATHTSDIAVVNVTVRSGAQVSFGVTTKLDVFRTASRAFFFVARQALSARVDVTGASTRLDLHFGGLGGALGCDPRLSESFQVGAVGVLAVEQGNLAGNYPNEENTRGVGSPATLHVTDGAVVNLTYASNHSNGAGNDCVPQAVSVPTHRRWVDLAELVVDGAGTQLVVDSASHGGTNRERTKAGLIRGIAIFSHYRNSSWPRVRVAVTNQATVNVTAGAEAHAVLIDDGTLDGMLLPFHDQTVLVGTTLPPELSVDVASGADVTIRTIAAPDRFTLVQRQLFNVSRPYASAVCIDLQGTFNDAFYFQDNSSRFGPDAFVPTVSVRDPGTTLVIESVVSSVELAGPGKVYRPIADHLGPAAPVNGSYRPETYASAIFAASLPSSFFNATLNAANFGGARVVMSESATASVTHRVDNDGSYAQSLVTAARHAYAPDYVPSNVTSAAMIGTLLPSATAAPPTPTGAAAVLFNVTATGGSRLDVAADAFDAAASVVTVMVRPFDTLAVNVTAPVSVSSAATINVSSVAGRAAAVRLEPRATWGTEYRATAAPTAVPAIDDSSLNFNALPLPPSSTFGLVHAAVTSTDNSASLVIRALLRAAIIDGGVANADGSAQTTYDGPASTEQASATERAALVAGAPRCDVAADAHGRVVVAATSNYSSAFGIVGCNLPSVLWNETAVIDDSNWLRNRAVSDRAHGSAWLRLNRSGTVDVAAGTFAVAVRATGCSAIAVAVEQSAVLRATTWRLNVTAMPPATPMPTAFDAEADDDNSTSSTAAPTTTFLSMQPLPTAAAVPSQRRRRRDPYHGIELGAEHAVARSELDDVVAAVVFVHSFNDSFTPWAAETHELLNTSWVDRVAITVDGRNASVIVGDDSSFNALGVCLAGTVVTSRLAVGLGADELGQPNGGATTVRLRGRGMAVVAATLAAALTSDAVALDRDTQATSGALSLLPEGATMFVAPATTVNATSLGLDAPAALWITTQAYFGQLPKIVLQRASVSITGAPASCVTVVSRTWRMNSLTGQQTMRLNITSVDSDIAIGQNANTTTGLGARAATFITVMTPPTVPDNLGPSARQSAAMTQSAMNTTIHLDGTQVTVTAPFLASVRNSQGQEVAPSLPSRAGLLLAQRDAHLPLVFAVHVRNSSVRTRGPAVDGHLDTAVEGKDLHMPGSSGVAVVTGRRTPVSITVTEGSTVAVDTMLESAVPGASANRTHVDTRAATAAVSHTTLPRPHVFVSGSLAHPVFPAADEAAAGARVLLSESSGDVDDDGDVPLVGTAHSGLEHDVSITVDGGSSVHASSYAEAYGIRVTGWTDQSRPSLALTDASVQAATPRPSTATLSPVANVSQLAVGVLLSSVHGSSVPAVIQIGDSVVVRARNNRAASYADPSPRVGIESEGQYRLHHAGSEATAAASWPLYFGGAAGLVVFANVSGGSVSIATDAGFEAVAAPACPAETPTPLGVCVPREGAALVLASRDGPVVRSTAASSGGDTLPPAMAIANATALLVQGRYNGSLFFGDIVDVASPWVQAIDIPAELPTIAAYAQAMISTRPSCAPATLEFASVTRASNFLVKAVSAHGVAFGALQDVAAVNVERVTLAQRRLVDPHDTSVRQLGRWVTIAGFLRLKSYGWDRGDPLRPAAALWFAGALANVSLVRVVLSSINATSFGATAGLVVSHPITTNSFVAMSTTFGVDGPSDVTTNLTHIAPYEQMPPLVPGVAPTATPEQFFQPLPTHVVDLLNAWWPMRSRSPEEALAVEPIGRALIPVLSKVAALIPSLNATTAVFNGITTVLNAPCAGSAGLWFGALMARTSSGDDIIRFESVTSLVQPASTTTGGSSYYTRTLPEVAPALYAGPLSAVQANAGVTVLVPFFPVEITGASSAQLGPNTDLRVPLVWHELFTVTTTNALCYTVLRWPVCHRPLTTAPALQRADQNVTLKKESVVRFPGVPVAWYIDPSGATAGIAAAPATFISTGGRNVGVHQYGVLVAGSGDVSVVRGANVTSGYHSIAVSLFAAEGLPPRVSSSAAPAIVDRHPGDLNVATSNASLLAFCANCRTAHGLRDAANVNVDNAEIFVAGCVGHVPNPYAFRGITYVDNAATAPHANRTMVLRVVDMSQAAAPSSNLSVNGGDTSLGIFAGATFQDTLTVIPPSTLLQGTRSKLANFFDSRLSDGESMLQYVTEPMRVFDALVANATGSVAIVDASVSVDISEDAWGCLEPSGGDTSSFDDDDQGPMAQIGFRRRINLGGLDEQPCAVQFPDATDVRVHGIVAAGTTAAAAAGARVNVAGASVRVAVGADWRQGTRPRGNWNVTSRTAIARAVGVGLSGPSAGALSVIDSGLSASVAGTGASLDAASGAGTVRPTRVFAIEAVDTAALAIDRSVLNASGYWRADAGIACPPGSTTTRVAALAVSRINGTVVKASRAFVSSMLPAEDPCGGNDGGGSGAMIPTAAVFLEGDATTSATTNADFSITDSHLSVNVGTNGTVVGRPVIVRAAGVHIFHAPGYSISVAATAVTVDQQTLAAADFDSDTAAETASNITLSSAAVAVTASCSMHLPALPTTVSLRGIHFGGTSTVDPPRAESPNESVARRTISADLVDLEPERTCPFLLGAHTFPGVTIDVRDSSAAHAALATIEIRSNNVRGLDAARRVSQALVALGGMRASGTETSPLRGLGNVRCTVVNSTVTAHRPDASDQPVDPYRVTRDLRVALLRVEATAPMSNVRLAAFNDSVAAVRWRGQYRRNTGGVAETVALTAALLDVPDVPDFYIGTIVRAASTQLPSPLPPVFIGNRVTTAAVDEGAGVDVFDLNSRAYLQTAAELKTTYPDADGAITPTLGFPCNTFHEAAPALPPSQWRPSAVYTEAFEPGATTTVDPRCLLTPTHTLMRPATPTATLPPATPTATLVEPTRSPTRTVEGSPTRTVSPAALKTRSASVAVTTSLTRRVRPHTSTAQVPTDAPTPAETATTTPPATTTTAAPTPAPTRRRTRTVTLLPPPPPPATPKPVVSPAAESTADAVATTTTVVGTVSSPAAAMQAARAVGTLQLAKRCHGVDADGSSLRERIDNQLAFPQSLIPWVRFGPAQGQYYRGAIVGNLVFAVTGCCLAVTGGYVLTSAVGMKPQSVKRHGSEVGGPETRPIVRAIRIARMPGLVVVALGIGLDGSVLSAAILALNTVADNSSDLGLVALAVVLNAGLAVFVLVQVMALIAVIRSDEGSTSNRKKQFRNVDHDDDDDDDDDGTALAPTAVVQHYKFQLYNHSDRPIAIKPVAKARVFRFLFLGETAWIPATDGEHAARKASTSPLGEHVPDELEDWHWRSHIAHAQFEHYGGVVTRYRGPVAIPGATILASRLRYKQMKGTVLVEKAAERIAPYFLFIDIVLTLLMGFAQALATVSCSLAATVALLTNAAAFLLAALIRPYAVPAKNVVIVVMAGLLTAASLCLIVASNSDDLASADSWAERASALSVAAAFFSLVSVGLSVCRMVLLKCVLRGRQVVVPPNELGGASAAEAALLGLSEMELVKVQKRAEDGEAEVSRAEQRLQRDALDDLLDDDDDDDDPAHRPLPPAPPGQEEEAAGTAGGGDDAFAALDDFEGDGAAANPSTLPTLDDLLGEDAGGAPPANDNDPSPPPPPAKTSATPPKPAPTTTTTPTYRGGPAQTGSSDKASAALFDLI